MLHSGIVVPQRLESMGYNSAMAPNSYDYLSIVQQEDEQPRKSTSSEQNKAADTPDNVIAEGRVK